MNKMNIPAACVLLAGIVLLSGCGKQMESTNAGSSTTAAEQQGTTNASPSSSESAGAIADTTTNQESTTTSDDSASSDDILMIIDQSELPITKGGLTYWVEKLPKGYTLTGMRWDGKGKPIVSTFEQSVENETKASEGVDTGEGFYVGGTSGNQTFIYENSRKGEKGTLSFTFTNDAGKQLTWKKEITLK
ncbi:hypothetical protein [Paenibacillus kandeliae]|uniref:hypothetical protein n=1 Tax=Paenibacillus kandeliae TaxID=3231269 RepID=UPI00345B47AF